MHTEDKRCDCFFPPPFELQQHWHPPSGKRKWCWKNKFVRTLMTKKDDLFCCKHEAVSWEKRGVKSNQDFVCLWLCLSSPKTFSQYVEKLVACKSWFIVWIIIIILYNLNSGDVNARLTPWLSPLPPSSQPVVIAISYNDPYYVSFPTGLGTKGWLGQVRLG